MLAFAFVAAVGIPVASGDVLNDGRLAFLDYDFERAAELYSKYAQSLRKKPDAEGEKLLEIYERQLEIAENALENVQKIEIIDRIDVPSDGFFKAVKLPVSCGKLLHGSDVPVGGHSNDSDFLYSSEDGDYLLWSEKGPRGLSYLMESQRLLDGSWEEPTRMDDILNDGGNARNPFMLSDGITLYFAGDGEGSMGGYDLFVATKDASTGEFRQPMGLGYPFNSPYNEYLMAIDEDNGIGWWVTDRNQLEGQLSIYVFKTNEIRKNYVADEVEDIISLARIEDIGAMQDPATDYSKIIADIDRRASTVEKTPLVKSFFFPLPTGKVARTLADFRSNAARKNMAQYLEATAEHMSEITQLEDLRKRYHSTPRKSGASMALANQIRDLEKKLDWERERLKKMRNSIITAESER